MCGCERAEEEERDLGAAGWADAHGRERTDRKAETGLTGEEGGDAAPDSGRKARQFPGTDVVFPHVRFPTGANHARPAR